jgi:hypothetical protein
LETFALNAADPEKLQKSIEKHLGAQKWSTQAIRR